MRTLLTALVASLASSTPAVQDGVPDAMQEAELPAIVTTAEIIVRARVVESRLVPLREPAVAEREGVPVGITLTEVQVEHAFLGATVGEPLFVLAEGDASALDPGADCIFFLRRASEMERRSGSGHERALRKVHKATGDRPHFRAMESGVWRVAPDGSAVSVPALLPLPAALRGAPAGGPAGSPTEALTTWLDTAIERTTPRLVAYHATTGPISWRVQIEPDGSWMTAAGEAGRLEPEARRALMRVLDSDAFYELPRRIGATLGPCEGFHVLTLRSRRGVKSVSVCASPGNAEAAAAMQGEMDLALSIWTAIPGSDKP